MSIEFQALSDAVYSSKYQLTDKNGNKIDKDRFDTFKRVAKALAKNETNPDYWADKFYEAMCCGAVPAGRILGNAGAEEHKPNTSQINCVVADTIFDKIEGIGQSVKDSLITLSTGSGIGYEFCLAPETKILLSDLSWKAVKDVVIGDSLVGFDENLNLQKALFKESFVENVVELTRPCYRITTTKGEVVASSEHLWVGRQSVRAYWQKEATYRWVATEDLVVGDEIGYTIEPWEFEDSWEAGWFAGMLDGEGYFQINKLGKGVLGIGQNEGLLLDKLKEFLVQRSIEYKEYRNVSYTGKIFVQLRFKKFATWKILGSLRPKRLLPRSAELWQNSKLISGNHQTAKILKLEYLGEQPVIATRTSTKTLIANGLLSHNSTLRPKGSFVNGVGSSTSGPLPFTDIFDKGCFTIASAGGRRGAQMATFDLRHPDVLDFIKAKREDGRFRQFNISVLVPQSFFNDENDWIFRFPIRKLDPFLLTTETMWDVWHVEDEGYITNEHGQTLFKIYGKMPKSEIWKLILQSNYDYAEPGIIFIDRLNQENNLWFCEIIRSTNPCGEQALPPNGSCLLGSIDLTKFVDRPFTDNAFFDFDKFSNIVDVFTRLLDNVVEFNNLPLEAQRKEILRKRRHGMGFFGLGSALILLGIKYDSNEALEFAEKVTKLMALRGYITGCELAKEKGCAPVLEEYFEVTPAIVEKCSEFGDLVVGQKVKGINLFLQSPYMQRLLEDEPQLKQDLLLYGCRFSHHTSIAPTGTISLALGDNSSGGIEPTFAHQYFRNLTVEGKKTRQQQAVYSKEFLLYKKLFGANKTDEMLLKDLPSYFVTADTILWEAHVKMVAVVQKWVDSSISKCVEGSTLVPTNYGLKRMDELSKVLHTTHDSFEEPLTDLKVLCPDGKMRNVTNHYFGGEKQCKKIRFNNGYELTASLTHRVKTPFGWKTFGELLVGDSVLCSSDVTEYEGVAGHSLPEATYEGHYSKPILIPTQVTTDFSLFVGMWLADGSLTESNGAINFTNSDDFVIDQYVELIVELFSINPRIVYDTRSSKKLRTVTFASKRCCQWLKGLCGHKAGGKKIPDQIMTGSRDELLALLKGLSLDGCNLDNATCIYEGKSYLLAKQLFEISFVLGLEPRFGKKWVNTHNYYVYGVRIYGFNGCLESRKDSGGKHDRLVPIPNEVYTLEFDSSHPQRVIFGVIQRGERCSGSIKEATLIKLGVAYDPTIYSVLITDIEDVVTKVYDITVEESHDYSLGGIWSHNTINLPTDISFDEFKDVYQYAYSVGCKAVSTYRYNPETLGSILSRTSDLEKSRYEFTLDDGTVIKCKGNDQITYEGEVTIAENLFNALKEKTYGKF